jgi:predicted dehydrogenase
MDSNGLSRRDLLKGALAGASAVTAVSAASAAAPRSAVSTFESAAPSPKDQVWGLRFEPRDLVRVGIIGVGGRGSSLLDDLLGVPGVRVSAICDVVRQKVVRAQKRCMEKGQPEPTGYWRNEKDFENLCRRDDLDLILIATPWELHTPMALVALKNGHHVGLEVPSAQTLEECWSLVKASEEAQRHCVMLENCCYGYWEMMVWNMAHKGAFGELTHAEAAYIHDLRGLLMAPDSEGMWRWKPHTTRDANLYPTHGLGPVCTYLDVHGGDRMEALVSFSSREAALSEYVKSNPPAEEAKKKAKFIAGDMNSSLIRTAKGRTILLQHDVVTPRPYSRLNLLQGTKGAFQDYPARLALQEVEGGHRWLNETELKAKRAQWEHPMWKEVGEIARANGGHGGMDYIMLWRLIHCIRKGLTPDIDVYDLAAWAAPTALSEASVKKGGAPQKFPDFTRGRWKEGRPRFEG